MVSINVSDVVVGEGDGYVDVVVSLSEASTSEVSVDYATANGSATGYTSASAHDYISLSGTLTFAAGETTKVVRIQINQDTSDEGYERFYFTLDSPINATLAQSSATISIIDDEANVSTPDIYIDDVVVDEQAGTATFVVMLGGRTGGSSNSIVEVDYTTSDGSAEAGSDYTASSGTLTFAAGQSVQTVVVDITDDDDPEGAETFNLTLSDAVNGTIFNETAVATIGLSDTTSSQPTISVSDMVVGEDDSYVDIVVSLSAASTSEVSVDYATANGSATGYTSASAHDYISLSGTLTFAAGETTKVVRIQINQDTSDEGYERFYFTLDSPINATLTQSSATISIIDDEANVSNPDIYVDDVVVDEQAGTATFVVMLGGRTGGSSNSIVEVDYTTSDGTAEAGSDYTASSGTLKFAAGESVQTVVVDITDDTLAEGEETFNLTLSDAVNATIFDGTAVATIGVSDNASGSQPTVNVSDMVVGEDDSYVDIVVSLSAASASEVSVDYATANGSATGYSSSSYYDYITLSGTLTFAAGETTKVVRVQINQDTDDEGYERFYFTLDSPVNATLTQSSAIISIIDDEANVTNPDIYVDDVVVDEQAGTATFVVMLGGRTGGSSNSIVEVDYTTSDGTAEAGSDYTASSGTLKFAAGESVQTVVVDITDDSVAEGEETFNLTLSDAVNATIFDGSAVATIGVSDNASGSQPTINVSDMVVGEDDSYVDIVVSLSAASASEVSVDYATANGSATGYSSSSYYDYITLSGTLTFAAGETTKVVRVQINQDTNDEGYERFYFTLDSPVNATLTQSSAIVSIIDDEAKVENPQIYVDDVVVDEQAGTATFVVMLGGRTGGSSNSIVEVDYTTSDGTATAGSDYTASSGTLTFAAGQSVQTVVVDITDDEDPEGAETFNLTLSDAVNATIADGNAVAQIGVSDTTSSQPTISVSDMVVSEGDSYVDIVVSLSAASASEVSVDYATANGSATGYSSSSYYDYISLSGTLTFAAGETTKVVRVQINQDTSEEDLEQFSFTLDTAINATIADSSSSIYIYDDETNPTIFHYGNSDDVYTLTSASDIVIENYDGGNDTIETSFSYTLPAAYGDGTASCYVENLTLIGSAAIDGTGNSLDNVITGNTDTNTLRGLEGDDTLIGGGGVDTLVGGEGDDIYVVDNANDVTTESSEGGTDTVRSSLTWTLAANIENLVLTGSDAVNGTGNALNNTLTGNAKANVLRGLAGKDQLVGGAGNDLLDGGAGADTMVGGQGNDTYLVDNVGDKVVEFAGGGTDTVKSSVAWTLAANIETLIFTGTNSVRGVGNGLANTLTGNSGANTLIGNGGNDILNGGAGNDVLNGGTGVDTMKGGTGNDIYFVNTIKDTIVEGANAGTDTVKSSVSWCLGANLEKLVLTGAQTINGTGNALGNTITGNAAVNKLIGNGGNDTLNGGGGNDVLNGGAGNDTLNGGAGADAMRGGTGNDVYLVDSVNDKTIEVASGGTDTVQSSISWSLAANVEKLVLTGAKSINGTGNALGNTITGNAAANKLIGNGGNDILNGGGGNDVLDGGAGADTMRGGAGNDVYLVDSVNDKTIEVTSGGTDTVKSSISWSLAANVEKLVLTGAKSINGTGNALGNTITGNAAANKLIGNGGNDILNGGGGNDVLDGGAGADTMRGGAGNDVYLVDSVNDKTIEVASGGTDTVKSSISWSLAANVEKLVLTGTKSINGTGNALGNTITGNAAANKLIGNGGNDILNGGGGNDVLDGGAGADTMRGGAGNDVYLVDSVNDKTIEVTSGGTDTVKSSISWSLAANVEKLVLTGTKSINGTGNAFGNTITGNAAANKLIGNGGNDVLKGGGGNDTLLGGAGSDTLVGGAGKDSFVFNTASNECDTIVDFDGDDDSILLDQTVFSELATGTLAGSNFCSSETGCSSR